MSARGPGCKDGIKLTVVCAAVHGIISEHHTERFGLIESFTLLSCLPHNCCSQSQSSDMNSCIVLLFYDPLHTRLSSVQDLPLGGQGRGRVAISGIHILHPACGQYGGIDGLLMRRSACASIPETSNQLVALFERDRLHARAISWWFDWTAHLSGVTSGCGMALNRLLRLGLPAVSPPYAKCDKHFPYCRADWQLKFTSYLVCLSSTPYPSCRVLSGCMCSCE